MSFRLRVLALVSLVAVSAVGATAWLVLIQASQQVNDSVAADRQTVTSIAAELAGYGQQHGTWEGVARRVVGLGDRYQQRIKLVTELGDVVVDTDTEAQRTARPVVGPATLVDARATLRLPLEAKRPDLITMEEIGLYRIGLRFAACLTRHQVDVIMTAGPYGPSRFAAEPDATRTQPDVVVTCQAQAQVGRTTEEDLTEVAACSKAWVEVELSNSCLEKVFIERTTGTAPVPLRMYLGAAGSPSEPGLPTGPAIAAAGFVALLAIAGTALLSRRVLRPIGTLTAASRRLGEGDLGLRVPAIGTDELAELARSFNRMADSLQRGEERQKRLIADVAHELRTPLSNLRGYLEALKDGVIPPSAELFTSLHEEAVLQQRIVDDLQDLALAEAGSLAYHRTQVDLAELLETCRNAQQAVAAEAGVELVVEAPQPVLVRADSDRLRQMIGNLVSNALRATPAGGTVTLSLSGPEDGLVTVVVRDTGVGIAAADIPYIFDRFWRADAARGRTTGGSGLGLAIVRQIVTDHGGRIRAESQPGAGTTMTITLPAG